MDKTEKLSQGSDSQSRKMVTRRALVRAGWALPLVVASVSLPRNAFAQYAGGGGGGGNDAPPL